MSKKLVDSGALQIVRLALKRDADEGKTIRGEMLAELDAGTEDIPCKVNSVLVSLTRWSATEALASIENGNGLVFNIAGGNGSNAKCACMDAAKVLREAALRFEQLALESCPYAANIYADINSLEISTEASEASVVLNEANSNLNESPSLAHS